MRFSQEQPDKKEITDPKERKAEILGELAWIDGDGKEEEIDIEIRNIENNILEIRNEIASLEGWSSEEVSPKDIGGDPISQGKIDSLREKKDKEVSRKRQLEVQLKKFTPGYKDALIEELVDMNRELEKHQD